MSETLNLIYRANGEVVNDTNQDPGVPRVTGFSRYWLGVDLGQANDFTAICAIMDERLPTVIDGRVKIGPRERTVVFADKFRGVSYTDVVQHLNRLRNAPPFAGKTELAIDASSLGRVVSDQLWDQGVPHHAIQMTAGQEWNRKGRYINASKTHMIETTSVLFSAGDLTFAEGLPLRKEIESDIASFSLTTTAAGNQVITQSRNASGHGDLGISLIVAAWASQHVTSQYITVGQIQNYFG